MNRPSKSSIISLFLLVVISLKIADFPKLVEFKNFGCHNLFVPDVSLITNHIFRTTSSSAIFSGLLLLAAAKQFVSRSSFRESFDDQQMRWRNRNCMKFHQFSTKILSISPFDTRSLVDLVVERYAVSQFFSNIINSPVFLRSCFRRKQTIERIKKNICRSFR